MVKISKGKVSLVLSGFGIKIYWDGIEMTQGGGLNSTINTLGLWADSLSSEWQILEKGTDLLKIKVIFRDLPLNQIWKIKIKNEQWITWEIDAEIEELLHIDEFRVSCLVNSCYKTWISNYQQGDFPRLNDNWQTLYHDGNPSSFVGVRFPTKDEFLSAIVLEVERSRPKNLYPMIQSSPSNINANVIAVRHIGPEEEKDYYPGQYRFFSGKISLFKEDHLLDARIENLRINSLQRTIEEKTKDKKPRPKLKIVLANLPWQREGRWGVRAGSRWPHIKDETEGNYLPFPFFLAYATSLLQENGIDASIIDCLAENIPEEKFIEKISGMNLDCLVIETSTPSLFNDLRILDKISRAGISIVLCGPSPEIYETEFLKQRPFIHFVLYGEYELSLLELIKAIEDNEDLSRINGLIFRRNNEVIKNPKREPFDINVLPWPYRDGLPMDKYCDLPGDLPTPSVQMLGSRGCPFSCNFCLWPQVVYQGNHYRPRDIFDIVDEFEYLVKEKKFKSIYFDDDTFNIDKQRMLELSRAIKERRLQNTPWAIMARADLMDEEILREMKSSGLWAVKYGVESFNKELIRSCQKDLNLKKTINIIKLTRDLGIKVHLAFCLGFPGETKRTIQRTIEYGLSLKPYSVQFSILTPFPGTRLFEELDKQGRILTRDWSKYDGHYNCVFKPDNLMPEDLVEAKKRAYRFWEEYLRKKRGFWGDLKIFRRYLKESGFKLAFYKSFDYLKFVWLKKRSYLYSMDNIRSASKTNFLSIPRISRNILRNYPDVLGVFNGRYAFQGPSCVQIDLTNNCNNNCLACWCNSPLLEEKAIAYDIKNQTLPFDLVKKLLDELCQMGTKEIYFSGGGEPFIYPQIMEILEYAKSKHFSCLVNTNFTLLDKEKIKRLVSLGVDHLTVSTWASTAKTYFAIHPNKDENTFRQIIENLKFLNEIKQKVPHITLYNVIFNVNYGELKDMIALAKETGSESVEFTLVDTIPGKTDRLILNSEQIKELQRNAQEISQGMGVNGYFDGVQVCNFSSFLRRISSSFDLTKATYDRNVIDSLPCYIGWSFSRVMANGDVNACLKAHRIPMGNLYQQGFRQIWNGKKQIYFRKKTLVYKKKDSFFRLIGNDPSIKEAGCYKSCDDINRNIHIHNRIKSLTPFEKKIAKFLAKVLR